MINLNSDQQIIKAAYEDAVNALYASLFKGYLDAAGDAVKVGEADQHFMTGIGFARNSRDRAFALLATQTSTIS